MSADAILAAIRTQADDEVRAILDTARAGADALVEAARSDAARRVADALEAAEPDLAGEAARRVNVARLRLLHARARRRSDRVSAVYDAAGAELDELARRDDPRWRAAVERLRLDAVAACGGAGAVVSEAPGAGVVARSRDGRVSVDATLTTRLARARTLLADAVIECLERG